MPDKVASSSSTSFTEEQDTELTHQLAELRKRIEENCEPDGPIRQSLLPSLRASIEVAVALIKDGQPEIAAAVLNPVAKEVNRILERGY